MWRLSILFPVLAACSSTPALPQPPFRAGVAVVDLTPTRKVPLGGYSGRRGKPLTGIHDPVYAKALWLETDESRVCILTTDLIGASIEIRDRIKPDDASLILTASHTHSGPGGLGRGIWQLAMGKFDEALLEELTEKLRDVIDRARADRRPAQVAFAREAAPEFVRNRRRGDGPVDPDLNVMIVTDLISRPIAVLTNYAAHGTLLSEKNFLVSGDWPGSFQRAVEARIPAVALYTNGAEGDVAPRAPGGRSRFEKCDALGEALAKRVDNLVHSIDNAQGEVKLSYVERGVDLPSPTLSAAPKRSVLGLLRIGDVRFFCVPGEPAAALGLELKRRFPGSWILGLANDHLGYFLTEEEYRRGGYERLVSFYGPKMGPWLVAQLTEMREREDEKDRSSQPEGRRGKDDDRRQPKRRARPARSKGPSRRS